MHQWIAGSKRIWLRTAVLLLFFALALSSITQLSPTFDEQGFLTRGLGYLRGENQHMRVGHPLGLNALNASLLVSDESVHLPTADSSWLLPNFHRPSEMFMWEIGNDVAHVMFLARLPTIWLGLLLVALVGRWAGELTRRHGAVLWAMTLAAIEPNLLAHARLATTDFGLTIFAFLAGFALWRFWQRPSWVRAILAGLAFGLLQNTKFTAGLFVPLFALVIGLFAVDWFVKGRQTVSFFSVRSPLVMLIVAYPLAAFFMLWVAYGFQIGVMPDNLPTLPQLSGLTLPLSHHLAQLLDIGGRLQKSTPAFLAGNYAENGWWYYFPVAFLLKTPLPTLLLLLFAWLGLFWLAIKRRLNGRWLSLAALLVPAVGYFAIALTTDINLGYRHILPVLPFLTVFVVATLTWLQDNINLAQKWLQLPLWAFVVWLAAIVVWLQPHYLAFFNVLAGGPDGGWRYLVDSNLDWGQDLGNLKRWMMEHEVAEVWLSYFGEGRPTYYDIHYQGLDSFPPRLMNPQARPFYPHDPAPGIYAISATTLQGVHFANHDTFAWFREKTPLDKVGYSIFLYEVLPDGEPTDVVLAGLQLDEIVPEDFARFQTNQVTPHWVNGEAFLQPAAAEFWLVVAKGYDLRLAETAVSLQQVAATEQYVLYQAQTKEDLSSTGLEFHSEQDDRMVLLTNALTVVGEENSVQLLTTQWRNVSGPVPVKIYLHILNESGEIVAQWDGLDIPWEGWRAGDVLWQQHELLLTDDVEPGVYELRAGLYHPETAVRWQTKAGADFATLGQVEIQP